ncbi:MAG: hypothetical protein ACK456_07135 [Pseudanabaenaceae cyanobacterium]|jgi:hypothetical protein
MTNSRSALWLSLLPAVTLMACAPKEPTTSPASPSPAATSAAKEEKKEEKKDTKSPEKTEAKDDKPATTGGKVAIAKVESLEPFKHKSGVFSIEVPKGWKDTDTSKPGQEVTVQWTDPTGNALISVTVINAPKEPVAKEKLGEVLQQVLKDILGSQKDFAMEPPQPQPDGSTQVTFSYTESSGGVTAKVQGNSFIEQKEDKILILTFGSLADQFTQLKESYTKVANSIKVTTDKIP